MEKPEEKEGKTREGRGEKSIADARFSSPSSLAFFPCGPPIPIRFSVEILVKSLTRVVQRTRDRESSHAARLIAKKKR